MACLIILHDFIDCSNSRLIPYLCIGKVDMNLGMSGIGIKCVHKAFHRSKKQLPLHFENYLICLLLFHNPYFRYFSHKENSTEDDTGNNPFGQVIGSYNNSYSRQHDDSISRSEEHTSELQ